MATAIRGTVIYGQQPIWGSGDDMYNQQESFNGNYLVSANMPIIYQVIWKTTSGTIIDEMSIPTAEGDVVNALFRVFGTSKYPTPTGLNANWDFIGEIRKSRDIPNNNIVNGTIATGQRFTIDIQRMVADQLSYSLVPIGKGSWETSDWGGMNGGKQKQDNVTEAVSPYNVTANGCYRTIQVYVDFEVLDANGELVLASNNLASADKIRVINSVPSFSENPYLNQMRVLNRNAPSVTSRRRAMTNCPNSTRIVDSAPEYMLPLNPTSQSCNLYFYVKEALNGSDDTDFYNLYEVYGQAYNKDGSVGANFVLGSNWNNSAGTDIICSDISHTFQLQGATAFKHNQNQVAVQNVAPDYINSHAYAPQNSIYPYSTTVTPITANTSHYRVYVRGNYNTNVGSPNVWEAKRHSSVYWFSINREDNSNSDKKELFQPITFHWLNTAGGIDTYIARRNVVEAISSNKSFMETKLPNRFFMQDDTSGGTALGTGDYYNDGMRGWNTYQGGTEVLSVDAKINGSAYTEPLTAVESKWLREILQSPNVWIEERSAFVEEEDYRADAAYHLQSLNTYLRPDKTMYKPVIITNSEVVSLDQEKGLVMFNIEYTESQGVLTQRN
jgi:hypothetical protein